MTKFCEVCGISWDTEPHDHRSFKTLSPEEAQAHWRNRATESRCADVYVQPPRRF